jgi:hypothetical protein
MCTASGQNSLLAIATSCEVDRSTDDHGLYGRSIFNPWRKSGVWRQSLNISHQYRQYILLAGPSPARNLTGAFNSDLSSFPYTALIYACFFHVE